MTREKKKSSKGRMRRLRGAALGASTRFLGDVMLDPLRSSEQRAAARAARLSMAGAQLAKTMGELKGAAMKFGQLMSMESDLLPPEVAAAMRVLQKDAPPMAITQVHEVIEAALKRPVAEIFSALDPEPLGAASLGQVHRATLLSGREVAIKNQYPGIKETLDADLSSLRRTLKLMPARALRGRIDPYIAELRATFERESDYLAEAQNLVTARRLLHEHKMIVVPEPLLDLCAERVLTMELLQGEKLDDAFECLDQGTCDRIGTELVRAFSTLFHRHNWLHADPHSGNFLWLKEGKIGLLDFGCVRTFEQQRTDDLLRLVVATQQGAGERLVDLYAQLGFAQGQVESSQEVLEAFGEIALKPFMTEGDFDFGAWSFKNEMRHFLLQNVSFIKMTPEPDMLIYLRVLSGLRGILARGGCRVPVAALAQMLIEERDV